MLDRRSILLAPFALACWPIAARGAAMADPCAAPPAGLEPWRPPMVVSFGDGRVRLRFIAANHGTDPEDATHGLVRREVGRGASLVIVEGVPSSLGPDPVQVLADGERMLRDGHIAEPLYASVLAARRGQSFMGGDLGTPELITRSRRAGFADADILGAHVLRRLAGERAASPAALVARIRRFLPDVDASFDFEAWFRRAYDAAYSPGAARGLGTPCGTDLVARIVRAETDARNAHLCQLIMRQLDQRDDLLIVFGANHLLALYPALKGRLPRAVIK